MGYTRAWCSLSGAIDPDFTRALKGRRESLPGVVTSRTDALVGPYFQHQLARIYLLVGEPEQALNQLEPLLKIPYRLSPAGSRSTPPSPRSGATRASSGW
jgi:hypothetical protein